MANSYGSKNESTACRNCKHRTNLVLILVTPKVMNIFRDAGVDTFLWHPVLVDED